MKRLGDITKIDGHNVPLVDIITGGSPCQDLSVAGKRAGLEGARSGLFMEQIRITKELRNESIKQLRLRGADVDIRSIQPRYFVWENVPGAFSSNKGEDFRAVLEETAKIVCEDAVIPRPENGKWTPSGVILGEGWSIAWRVHDAQFWGVPQRRKRIALVADFGGKSAPEILFESEGLPGDSETSREEGQGTSTTSERDADPASYTLKIRGGVEVDSHGKKAGKGPLIQTELSGTLGVSQDQTLITKVVSVDEKMGQTYIGEEIGNTLGARDYKQPQAVVYGVSAYNSNAMKSSNPNSGVYEAKTTRTLDLNGGSPACNQGGIAIVQTSGVVSKGNGECFMTPEKHMSLSVGGGQAGQGYPCVCIEGDRQENSQAIQTYQQTTGALTPGAHPGSYNGQDAYNDMLVVDKSPCVYGLDRASFNQGQNAQYDFSIEEEKAQTLVSRGPGGVLSRQSVPYVQETTKE